MHGFWLTLDFSRLYHYKCPTFLFLIQAAFLVDKKQKQNLYPLHIKMMKVYLIQSFSSTLSFSQKEDPI